MHPLIRTARTTGLFYLSLAIAGALGFLIIRPQLFADDADATLAHLVGNEPLARVGIALELLVVLAQTATAVWFYRLFRTVDATAATGIAAFGMVNAIAILGSAALLATATEVATNPFGDAASTVQLLYLASGNLWIAGGLFFGLWLVPMGWCVLRSGWLPRVLGWLLVVGGAGYVLSAFVTYLAPGAGIVTNLLVVPASAGEFWILGYLITFGLRKRALAEPPPVERALADPPPAAAPLAALS